MLATLKVWLFHHLKAALSSFVVLCRQPFATFMTVSVIAVSLVLPALFWILSDNMEQLTHDWQHGSHVSLYLESRLSSSDEFTLLLQVRETVGVGHATLIPAADGLLELQKQEGMQDIMRYLPDNPVPSFIDVRLAPEVDTPEKLETLYSELQSYQGVEQAKIDMQWANRLHAMLHFIAELAHGLMALLAVVVVLIIGNTMRLSVHNRHEEIKVLKLVGARDSFILRPFLYAGVWYGLASALFAVLLVNILMISLSALVNQLATVYQMHYSLAGLSLRQMGLVILAAMLLGWLGATLSVKRQLSIIEP